MAVNFNKIAIDNILTTADKQFVSQSQIDTISDAVIVGDVATSGANKVLKLDGDGKIDTALLNTGTAEGDLITLAAGGKLSTSILPSLAISSVSVVDTKSDRNELTVEIGDVARIISDGDNNGTYILKDSDATVDDSWVSLGDGSGAVDSVAGKTGDVTLDIADIGSLQSTLDAKITSNVISAEVTVNSNVADMGEAFKSITSVYVKDEGFLVTGFSIEDNNVKFDDTSLDTKKVIVNYMK